MRNWLVFVFQKLSTCKDISHLLAGMIYYVHPTTRCSFDQSGLGGKFVYFHKFKKQISGGLDSRTSMAI